MITLLLTTALTLAPWWTTYHDPELNTLVDRALAANLDLKTAAARIAEARALAGDAKSKLLPSVNFSTSAGRLRGGFQQGVARIPNLNSASPSGSFVAPFETAIFQAGLDTRWELDFWGANRAGRTAATADVAAQNELRDDAALIVSAEVVRAYIELRGIEDRIQITNRSRDAQKDLLNLTQSRSAAGLASELDVERQRALLENTEATLPALENDRTQRLNRLRLLLGGQPYQPTAPSELKLPTLPETFDASLLKRRPDVRAAEARMAAATARLKQARTDLFPKVVLNGLMGRQTTGISGFTLGGGNFFNLAPQLQLPLFNGGKIRSNIAAVDARLEQARIEYEKEILAAMEEASNAIAGYRRQQERAQKLAAVTDSAGRSLHLSRELATAGLGDFLAVLDAQRTLLEAEFQHSIAGSAALVESVLLQKALAGSPIP